MSHFHLQIQLRCSSPACWLLSLWCGQVGMAHADSTSNQSFCTLSSWVYRNHCHNRSMSFQVLFVCRSLPSRLAPWYAAVSSCFPVDGMVFCHMCSAMAALFVRPLMHASLCPFQHVFSWSLVSPMYTFQVSTGA